MRLLNMSFSILSFVVLLFCACSDPCDGVVCANGDCIEGVCDCDPGFQGPNCDQRIPCFEVNCNNGTCENDECNCDEGYEGEFCDQKIPCFGIDCNNGTCEDERCNCDEGYEGEFCEKEIREPFIGRWSGPNGCNIDIDQVPIPDSISITIFKSEEDIFSVELALDLDEFGQVPRQVAVLEGNSFFIEPDPVEIMGFIIDYDIKGTLRSSGILEIETDLMSDINGFPITISCKADLEKD